QAAEPPADCQPLVTQEHCGANCARRGRAGHVARDRLPLLMTGTVAGHDEESRPPPRGGGISSPFGVALALPPQLETDGGGYGIRHFPRVPVPAWTITRRSIR